MEIPIGRVIEGCQTMTTISTFFFSKIYFFFSFSILWNIAFGENVTPDDVFAFFYFFTLKLIIYKLLLVVN